MFLAFNPAQPLAALPAFVGDVSHWIVILFGVLLIFNLIIVVHEVGHFLAARWRGLIIEEFGIWFGKPLWKKKFNGVWYSFGTIPFGGFVKLPQLGMKAVEGESETAPEELPPIKPWDKIIVAFAGPLFSFLLALALACLLWNLGKPYREEDRWTVVGEVTKNGPAEKAGIKPGDRILTVDGKPVKTFFGQVDSVQWAVVSSTGSTVDVVVERNGKTERLTATPYYDPASRWHRKPLRKLLFGPYIRPLVGAITPGGAAEKAGVQKGDFLKEINGQSIYSLTEFFTIGNKNPKGPFPLVFDRRGERFTTTLTPMPAKDAEDGMDVGIEWGEILWEHPSPARQVKDSVRAIVNLVRAVTTPKSDVKPQQMSGPLGIMNLYRRILQSDFPFHQAIAFSVFFNVNLALINLLPLPILDGGHIMFGFLELIRRRPVRNTRIIEVIEMGCVLLVLGFILYVSYFDVGDWFAKKQGPPNLPAAAATPTPVPESSPPPDAPGVPPVRNNVPATPAPATPNALPPAATPAPAPANPQ